MVDLASNFNRNAIGAETGHESSHILGIARGEENRRHRRRRDRWEEVAEVHLENGMAAGVRRDKRHDRPARAKTRGCIVRGRSRGSRSSPAGSGAVTSRPTRRGTAHHTSRCERQGCRVRDCPNLYGQSKSQRERFLRADSARRHRAGLASRDTSRLLRCVWQHNSGRLAVAIRSPDEVQDGCCLH